MRGFRAAAQTPVRRYHRCGPEADLQRFRNDPTPTCWGSSSGGAPDSTNSLPGAGIDLQSDVLSRRRDRGGREFRPLRH
jgi:hypothetical protein